MSDEISKRLHDALTNHVRARLRMGRSLREIDIELMKEVAEVRTAETVRHLMQPIVEVAE